MSSMIGHEYTPIPGNTIELRTIVERNRADLIRCITSHVSDGQEFRLPIVCILNGTGGSGKDTFASMCKEAGLYNAVHYSTINPVKKAADVLISFDSRDNVLSDVANKRESYRLLLHNIKMAWSEFSNGSTHYICNLITDIVADIATKRIENPVVIFVDVREPAEIERLQRAITEIGLIAIAVLIQGMVDPKTHDNDGDRNVSDYKYDYVIENVPGNMNALKMEACIFTSKVLRFFHSDEYNLCNCRERYHDEKTR